MRDLGWRLHTLLLVGALVLLSRTARADLTWQAPAECPSAAQVSSEIERLLAGSEYPTGALNEFSLAVTREGGAGMFVVRITRTQSGSRQERVVEGADCGELAQAAALAVALAINPELEPAPSPTPTAPASPVVPAEAVPAEAAAATAPGHTPVPPPAPPRAAAPPPTAGSDPQAAQAPPPNTPIAPASPSVPPMADQGSASKPAESPGWSHPHLSAFALVTGDSGSMPEAALGLGGGVAAAGEATRVQVALELFSSTETEPDAGGAYAHFGLYRAHASGCYSPFADRVFLFGCATLQVGVLRAQGRGIAEANQVNRAWFAAGADLLVLGSLAERTWLQLRGGVARPLIERNYVMNGSSVHEVSSWVFDAGVGVEFRFN
ncbi:MAG TPA: hypothetical protein VI197_20050 [Polyangiaceae bacterium]